MINIKSPREVALIKEASRLVAKVFEEVGPLVKPGVTTQYLADMAEKVIQSGGGIAACKGYGGFPGAICVSVNEVIVHGIPSNKRVLKDGDIVSLDVVAQFKGYHGDACRTYPVGVISERAEKLVKTTKASFFEGVSKVKKGAHLGDICSAIQEFNESHGYSLPTDYTGHGIGSHLHEDPSIPNVGKEGTGPILQVGMCLAIEPMVAEGKPKVRILGDGWTAKMKDGKLSAHYENTVVVTEEGYEVLTKLKTQTISDLKENDY